MSDRYFQAGTNREMLQEYLELRRVNTTGLSSKERGKILSRKYDIEHHIFFEVISQFADINGAET